MGLLWLALGIGVAVLVVRTILADRRAQRANAEALAEPAPKKKKRKTKPAAAAAPPAEPDGPVIPSSWGWAKVHLAAAELKALGYYYRDKSAGYSFKILVELNDSPSDEEIRERARAKAYVASSTFRLGAHDTHYAGAREGEMRAMTEAAFEAGAGASDPACAIVMMLTTEEKRAYDLPAAMPHIDVYL